MQGCSKMKFITAAKRIQLVDIFCSDTQNKHADILLTDEAISVIISLSPLAAKLHSCLSLDAHRGEHVRRVKIQFLMTLSVLQSAFTQLSMFSLEFDEPQKLRSC